MLVTKAARVPAQRPICRNLNHRWPMRVAGVSKTTNFGHFDPSLESQPTWYQSLIKAVVKSNLHQKYINLMGYRAYGLHFEDVLLETPDVQEALNRLPKEVLSDRDDRIKQALVLNCMGEVLPKDQQPTVEQDVPYLAPYLAEVIQERRDKEHFRPK
eukprot:TRINITY_DN2599_c0_g1_i2.p1 TRINITY_DN2599_c0_g1~~TRINITY_DN2599_c0_g1_i2.p1  ORF type:complete len:157 (-),score=49.12 TRINITY_DN2599_c0_g1_i2:145-615(-)